MTLTLLLRTEPRRCVILPDVQWIDCDGTELGIDWISAHEPEMVQRWRFPLVRVADLQLSEP